MAGVLEITTCRLSCILIRGTVNDRSKLKCLDDREHLEEAACDTVGQDQGYRDCIVSTEVRTVFSGLETA